MTDDDHKPLTATTVRELGIQFDGFKEVTALQFKEINGNLTDLIQTIKDTNSSKADQKDFIALSVLVDTKADKKDVNAIEIIQGKSWIKNTASAIIGAIITGMVALIVFFLTNIHK